MEAYAHAVGAAVAAGGGVHVYIYDILLAIALLDEAGDDAGNLGGVGVADADAVLFNLVSQLLRLHKMIYLFFLSSLNNNQMLLNLFYLLFWI